MKKFIIILSLTILSVNKLQAQVNKEVEVTKSYVPTVQRVTKPILKAEVADTVYMNPDVDYNVMPLAINTQLQTLPIKPATVTYWEFNKPATAQIKVGAGLPFATLLQGYVSSHNSSVGYLAANVDHRGNYSKIDGVNATQALNSASLAGGVYIEDYLLAGDVAYSNDMFNKYAFRQETSPFVNCQEISPSLYFGDSFVDLSKFNFGVDAEYSHFFDRENNIENGFAVAADLGKNTKVGTVMFNVGYQHISAGTNYKNQIFNLSGSISRQISDWRLLLGVKYYLDKMDAQMSHNYIIPELEIKKSVKSAISPFIKVGGSLEQNSFSELVKINPYVKAGTAALNTVEYNSIAGIEGQFASSAFRYNLNVAYTVAQNSRFWELSVVENSAGAGSVYDNFFDVKTADLNTTSLNLELDYKPVSNLTVAFDAHYYLYNEYDLESLVNSKPNFDGSLSVEYRPRKFGVGVSADFVGERKFAQCQYVYNQDMSVSTSESVLALPSTVDLSVYCDWQKSENLTIFVEGSNLCNARLYPYPCYRGFGIQVLAGVKLRFR